MLYEFHPNKLLEKNFKNEWSPFSIQIRDLGSPQHIPDLKTENYKFVLKSHYHGHEIKPSG